MKQTLKPGQYMKVTSVRLSLSNQFPNIEMEANKLTKYESEYDVYFSTSDIKSIMPSDLFKDLECKVTTYMIL